MTIAGAPERIGRWSPEQRAAKQQRQRAVIWLVDQALIPRRVLMERYPNINAHVDYEDGGGRGRPWMTDGDLWREARHLAGPPSRPRWYMDDVRPVEPPCFPAWRAVEWMARESCESVNALAGYRGARVNPQDSPAVPARRRGTNGWSMTDLDRRHPDATCPPPTPRGPRARPRSSPRARRWLPEHTHRDRLWPVRPDEVLNLPVRQALALRLAAEVLAEL